MKAAVGGSPLGAWWAWVGGVGLLLIAATVVYPHAPYFDQRWRLIDPFNLAAEQNAAVWWSGVVLFTASVLFYEFYCRAVDGLRLPWLLLAVLMITLSADEVGSFHERLGGWRNMILAGLPFGLMFVYAIVRLLVRQQTRRAAGFILAGFLCFSSIGIQEFVEQVVSWPGWARGMRAGVEEGTELIGSFLVLCGIMVLRGRSGFDAVLSVPGHLLHLPAILLTGVLLHLGIGAFAAANFDDLAMRGNPGSWYPAVVFLLLSVAAFGKGLEGPAEIRLFWRMAAAVFLISSLSAVFFRVSVAANVIGLPRLLLLNFYFVYAGVIAVAAVALLSGSGRSVRHLLLLAAMVTAVAVELLSAGAMMPHLALGVFAYFAWHFFVLERTPVGATAKDMSAV